MAISVRLGAFSLALLSASALAEPYISLSAGVAHLSGSGVELNKSDDVNPLWNAYNIADANTWLRLAAGYRWGSWSAELGLAPRAGRYHRSLDWYSVPEQCCDTVGEIVDTAVIDARVTRFWRRGRWEPYAFGSVAAVRWHRDWWDGHELTAEDPRGWRAKFNDQDPLAGWAYWRESTGTAFAAGGGAGVGYQLSPRWTLYGEVGALFGPYQSIQGSAGVRLSF